MFSGVAIVILFGGFINMCKNKLQLDWLSFSWVPKNLVKNGYYFESSDVLDEFLNVFPELKHDYVTDQLYLMDSGKRFYDNFLVFGDSWGIRYDNNMLSNKGVNVEIHPSGLEFWFDLFDFKHDDLESLFSELIKRNCHISRIDLCFDDYNKTFSPSWYNKRAINNCIVSGAHSFEYIGPCTGDRGGTFYIPARTSQMRRKMLRIYDKGTESNGEIDAIRYEFTLNHQVAHDTVVKMLLEKRFDFKGFISGFLSVKEFSDDVNKSRKPDCKEWFDWVNNLEFSE